MNPPPISPATASPRPRLAASPLFWINLLLAGGLLLLVLAAPFLPSNGPRNGGGQLLRLFAKDATLRQTAFAAAIGLVVTAFVFFRSPAATRAGPAKPPRLPPTNVIGA
jgi:hypothetical protein